MSKSSNKSVNEKSGKKPKNLARIVLVADIITELSKSRDPMTATDLFKAFGGDVDDLKKPHEVKQRQVSPSEFEALEAAADKSQDKGVVAALRMVNKLGCRKQEMAKVKIEGKVICIPFRGRDGGDVSVRKLSLSCDDLETVKQSIEDLTTSLKDKNVSIDTIDNAIQQMSRGEKPTFPHNTVGLPNAKIINRKQGAEVSLDSLRDLFSAEIKSVIPKLTIEEVVYVMGFSSQDEYLKTGKSRRKEIAKSVRPAVDNVAAHVKIKAFDKDEEDKRKKKGVSREEQVFLEATTKKRNIERALESLRSLGPYVLSNKFGITYNDEEMPVKYTVEKDSKFGQLRNLTRDQALALTISAEYLKGIFSEDVLEWMRTLSHLTAEPDEEGNVQSASLEGKVGFVSDALELIPAKYNEDVYRVVIQAVQEGKLLDLTYLGKRRKNVWPLALIKSGPSVYFICHYENEKSGISYTHSNYRTMLAMHRIESAKICLHRMTAGQYVEKNRGKAITPSLEFDLAKYVARDFMFNSKDKLETLAFSISLEAGRSLMQTPLADSQKIVRQFERHCANGGKQLIPIEEKLVTKEGIGGFIEEKVIYKADALAPCSCSKRESYDAPCALTFKKEESLFKHLESNGQLCSYQTVAELQYYRVEVTEFPDNMVLSRWLQGWGDSVWDVEPESALTLLTNRKILFVSKKNCQRIKIAEKVVSEKIGRSGVEFNYCEIDHADYDHVCKQLKAAVKIYVLNEECKTTIATVCNMGDLRINNIEKKYDPLRLPDETQLSQEKLTEILKLAVRL